MLGRVLELWHRERTIHRLFLDVKQHASKPVPVSLVSLRHLPGAIFSLRPWEWYKKSHLRTLSERGCDEVAVHLAR